MLREIDMKDSFHFQRLRKCWALVLMTIVAAVPAAGQQAVLSPADDTANLIRQLTKQVSELQSAVTELREEARQYRSEIRQYHDETQQLRDELRSVQAQPQAIQVVPSSGEPAQSVTEQAAATTAERISRLEEQFDLLSGKVDEQYQTKVESASKYRVRLSGIVLLNLFSNQGAVDNLDYPALAMASMGRVDGSFGGTLRQSQVGLEVFGPTIAGARVRGNLQLDLAGGFPNTENGVTLGLMRLRTAIVRMDWQRTSIVGGQDAPLFSPLSPTSLASLALSALSYSGNLWTWVPQIRVEHRIQTGEKSQVSVQAGILDPLTGERPALQFDRLPQAGEASRQPGYAARIAWTSGNGERAATLGTGGYYSRQNWSFDRTVDGWAATADWSVPLGRMFTITGEFYRGRAIGGFGGALGGTVVFNGPISNPTTHVAGLNGIGGWTQLKLRATPKLEFNVAGGQDNPFASELRFAMVRDSLRDYDALRNRSVLTNFIYRPRSDLLLSAEYRHIRSFDLMTTSHSADHINLTMGVLF